MPLRRREGRTGRRLLQSRCEWPREKEKLSAKLTWHPADSLKLPLLKQHLIVILPYISQVEDGFGDEERGSGGVDLARRE